MTKHRLLITLFAAVVFIIAANSAQAYTYTYAISGAWQAGTNVTVGNSNGELSDALGAPDTLVAYPTDGYLSLGLGGAALFYFGIEFDAAAIIYETTRGNRTDLYESADVYVSDSLSGITLGTGVSGSSSLLSLTSSFQKVGSINNQSQSTVLDLSGLGGSFSYLLIVDTSSYGIYRDGFDIDAVGVTAVPEPSTILLIGFGLSGMAALGRKKFSKIHK